MTSTTLTKLGYRQLNPIPTDERLNNFYESEYYHLIKSGGRANELRRLMEGGDAAKSELNWLRSTLYVDCADAIREHAAVNGPVLDIGCGTGNLVEYLCESGLDGEGIEPSLEAAQLGAERGLKVRQATLEQLACDPEAKKKYRAVTMLNVLEHVPDPIGFLEKAKSLIADGGIAIVRVPNDFSELQRIAEQLTDRKHWWVAAPDHINYFSRSSMTAIFGELGFEVADMYADFPMEFFILFGMNYVDSPPLGERAHDMRCKFELGLPKETRRAIYRALTAMDIGRDLLVVARLPG